MIAIEIADIRKIMNKLLLSETFDRFQLIEASITTGNSFYISGAVHPEFYEDPKSVTDAYSLWKDMRPFCLSVIKGKQTPVRFKMVFSMRDKDIRKYLEQHGLAEENDDITSLSFHLHYERKRSVLTGEEVEAIDDTDCMICTTGFARRNFVMDKTVEKLWDKTIEDFIRKQEEQA